MAQRHRQFATGATRDADEGKPDYEAFLSPLVVYAYGVHMKRHTKGPDGKAREGDDWQQGIPLGVYMKSMWRHFFDVWATHRRFGQPGNKHQGIYLAIRKERIVTALCALLFNVMGYLHEYLKANPDVLGDFEND